MSVTDELFTRLTTFAGLQALIGDRAYPVEPPQRPAYPALTYEQISAVRPSAMGKDVGVVRARFQINVWTEDADTGPSAFDNQVSVKEQVRLALQRWTNASGTVVQDTFFLNEGPNTVDTEGRVHRLPLDFEINYEES